LRSALRTLTLALMLVARWVVALALAVLAVGSATIARAGDSGRGKELFEEGRDLFRKKAYREAAAKFEHAYRVDPVPHFLFNIAKCRENLGEHGRAVQGYERYLQVWPESPQKPEVEKTIAALEKKLFLTLTRVRVESAPPGASVQVDGAETHTTPVSLFLAAGKHTLRFELPGHLEQLTTVEVAQGQAQAVQATLVSGSTPGRIRVVGGPSGAAIWLDGAPVGTTPLAAPLEASPGPHSIEAKLEGKLPFTAMIDVEAGKERELPLGMLDLPSGPEATVTKPDEEGFRFAGGAGALLGVGAAAAVGSIVTWVVYEREKGAATAARDRLDRGAYDAHYKQAERLFVSSYVSLGVAIAGGGAAVVWLLVDNLAGAPTGEDAPKIGVRVLPSLGGATLQGRF
jgi:hypothetical protein